MGKRKIEIKKIEDRHNRSVTFTKRRDGLFKKAETASQKFGLQIGIVVFSPAGKPFTFCNSSSSLSLDAIIDTYMSNSSSSSSLPSSSSSSSVVVVGNKRSRSDDGDVQVIETEKKKKKKTMMNDAVVTPCITIQDDDEDEDEKLGFHSDHYKNIDSDQELRNEFIMGTGENAGIVTGEMTMMESSQFLVEAESQTTCWAPDVELQEILNLDDFEFDHHPHHHCDDKIMGLLPPQTITSTTPTSLCGDSMLAPDMMNVEEVGVATNEDDGYTLEEWEQIFSTSPTSVVDITVVGNSCMNQQVSDDDWFTQQEFLQLLCS